MHVSQCIYLFYIKSTTEGPEGHLTVGSTPYTQIQGLHSTQKRSKKRKQTKQKKTNVFRTNDRQKYVVVKFLRSNFVVATSRVYLENGRRRGEIRCKLQYNNRKSHTGFRLLSKSIILNELKRFFDVLPYVPVLSVLCKSYHSTVLQHVADPAHWWSSLVSCGKDGSETDRRVLLLQVDVTLHRVSLMLGVRHFTLDRVLLNCSAIVFP